eukprot:GILJ01019879.1.p1 GENE.GILJ01019879.1~~GILJ01019879.1.p1  ORF type:complete len:351 (-),score=35.64 GILJ01019879.1:68-1120(-)
MDKIGVCCRKITVEDLCVDKNQDLLFDLQYTLVLVHCDAFIELVCSQRKWVSSQSKRIDKRASKMSDPERVFRQLKTLDARKYVYPSLHILRQTQDKLGYMRLMKTLSPHVQTATTWLPDEPEYCFFKSNIGPDQDFLIRYVERHEKTGFVMKGSPSGYGDSVNIFRPTDPDTSLRAKITFWKDLVASQKDVFLQELVDHCGYDIRTHWKGTELRYIIATKFLDQVMEIVETVFIHENGNFDASTGERRTDMSFCWANISNVVSIGETILKKMEVEEYDFIRLDFLYVQKSGQSRLLLSDVDFLGCYCGYNVEYDIREGNSPIQDVVDCLQKKIQTLERRGPKRVKPAKI